MSSLLNHPLGLAEVGVGGILALAVLAWLASLARRASRARIATAALVVPAVMSLALSASTSYRYAGQHLAITDVVERMALCGVAEALILGFTAHSWATKSKGSAWTAYAIVCVQAVPAFAVSGGTGGIVRIVLGPIALAVTLHRLLGIEAKLSGTVSNGLLASAVREIRERLTARLGIGRRGADSAEIARSRAADRAVRLASRRKLGNRAAARLAVAVDAAQHGLGDADAARAEAAVVARVVRRKSVAGLHGISVRHVWATSTQGASQGATQGPHTGGVPALYPLSQRTVLAPFGPFPGAFNGQAAPFSATVNTLPDSGPVDPAENAKQMRDQGLSYGQIADRLGRSKSWVHGAVNGTTTGANGSTV